MKVAISNIAWNPKEDKDILFLLKKYAIPAIELAPTMIWKEPTKEASSSIKAYRKFWNREGISIESIQALLFGHPELKIFEGEENRKKTLLYIEKMIHVCALLGVKDIIFGSPANRDTGKLSFDQTLDIADEFFNNVGNLAQKNNIFFCIEPIPIEYGTNFINNSLEGITLVKRVNHPHFRLHLDSAALMLAKENYEISIKTAFPCLRHMHISEKKLIPIGKSGVDHKTIAQTLKRLNFEYWLSIEMRRNENGSNVPLVEEALKFVKSTYVSKLL